MNDLHNKKSIGLKDVFRCLIQNIRFMPPDYHKVQAVCGTCNKQEFCKKLRKFITEEWRGGDSERL